MVGPPNQQAGFEKSLDLLTSLCLTYVLCSAVLRSWVRRNLYGIDDTVIAVAIAVCIGHFATNYIALAHGAGKPWHHNQEESNLQLLNSATIAGIVAFAISLYLSKIAVAAFLLRLTKNPKQLWLYQGTIGMLIVIAVASLLIVTTALPARSGYYWTFYENASDCRVPAIRWIAFTAFDICTEAILMILPIYQLWSIQMPFSKKAIVICAFYLRMPVIGLSIARLVYTNRLCRATTDPGLDSALVAIWMQVEVSWAIVSSTFSAVRAFPMNSNSSFGFGFTSQAGPESYNLSRMEKSTPGSSNDSSEARHQIVQNSCERLRIGIEASAKPSQSSPLRLAPSRDQHRIQINTQPCPRLEADERYADNKP